MATEKSIIERLVEAKVEIKSVGKTERNTQGQGYNYRGVDAVVNAAAPVFAKLGILVVPNLIGEPVSEAITYGAKNTPGFRTRLTVAYVFYGPDGSNVTSIVAAEAIDSGDKSTAKAMSVAYRTALLQVLTLPTNDPDPDSQTYEVNRPGVEVTKPQLTSEQTQLKALLAEKIADTKARKTYIESVVFRDVEGVSSLTPDEVNLCIESLTKETV